MEIPTPSQRGAEVGKKDFTGGGGQGFVESMVEASAAGEGRCRAPTPTRQI